MSDSPPRSDADVPGWLDERGIPGIVDLHVHFMPDRVQEKVWAFFDRVGAVLPVLGHGVVVMPLSVA